MSERSAPEGLVEVPGYGNFDPAMVEALDGGFNKIGIIDPLDWHGQPIPERRWLVPDIFPLRNVTMLAGDGGVGKSQVALQLLAACALGKKWLGQPTKTCKAFGLFCEDDEDELHRRMASICRLYGTDLGSLENLALCSRVGLDSTLMDFPSQWEPGEPTGLYGEILDHCMRFEAQVLVLDSLHDLFGGNENARPQARQFIQALRQIAMEIDGAVILTAHPSLSGRNTGTGEAGSTAWNNAVRSRLYLKDADDHADGAERVLKTMKSNYGPTDGEIRLRWSEGTYQEIVEDQGMIGSIKRGNAETVFMECLHAVTREGRNVSESKHSGNFAPKLFTDRPEGRNYGKTQFRRAMESLFQAGKIRVEAYGRGGDPRQRIVAVQPKTEGEGR